MKYLLDPHIWLWSLMDPGKLGINIIELLEDKDYELCISPITVWETLVLAEKGRTELSPSPKEWIAEALKRSPVKEARRKP